MSTIIAVQSGQVYKVKEYCTIKAGNYVIYDVYETIRSGENMTIVTMMRLHDKSKKITTTKAGVRIEFFENMQKMNLAELVGTMEITEESFTKYAKSYY